MLDLVPFEETAAAKAKARGGDIWVTHRNIEDVSLYEKYGKIRRVPIEAMTSTPDLTPTGEVIREIVEPQRMDDYHALQNTATGGLLNVRPVGKSYALVPHDGLFKAQARQLAASDLPLGNVEVVTASTKRGRGFTGLSTSTTCRTFPRHGTAIWTGCAVGWTCSTASTCHGPCKSSRLPTVTYVGTRWFLAGKRRITNARFTGVRCHLKR